MNRPPADRAHRRAIVVKAARLRTEKADRQLGRATRLFRAYIEETRRIPEIIQSAYADALDCHLAYTELVLDRSVA